MPPRLPLTVPTVAALPSSRRIPSSNPTVSKALSKLSRSSLLSLVEEWLKTRNQTTCGPVLTGADVDDGAIYEPAQTLEELREIYQEFRHQKGGKREVVDRVLEGDWRNGISLRQLAMADVQYLQDHPASQKWTALRLNRVSLSEDGPDTKTQLPRFHGHTFVKRLQAEIGGLMKAHYHLTRLSSCPMALLRIFIHDSPYNDQASVTIHPPSQTLYVAFPDNTSFVYISSNGAHTQSTADNKSSRKLIIDAIPKAFSRAHERYELKSTALSAKSLSALIEVRGPGRGTSCAGGWSIFADGSVENSPVVTSVQASVAEPGENKENVASTTRSPKRRRASLDTTTDSKDATASKRRKLIAQTRFGNTALPADGKGIERLQILISDPFSLHRSHSPEAAAPSPPPAPEPRPRRGRRSTLSLLEDSAADVDDAGDTADAAGGATSNGSWRPRIQLTFHGTHVFAGIRKLVETGAVDGAKMPGWMTGEETVSVGVVKNGRIRGSDGSGL